MAFDLYASHQRVRAGEWLFIIGGLRGQSATDELIARQDRVRRSGEPVRFRLVPEGETPETP